MKFHKYIAALTAFLLTVQCAVLPARTDAAEIAVSAAAEDAGTVETASAAETDFSLSGEMAAAMASGTYVTDSYVNPLYEDLTIREWTIEEAESGFQLMTEAADVVFHDTIDAAADVLLDGMKDREATITVGVTTDLYNELAAVTSAHKEIFFRAYEHDPADPTGGDYIRFTFGGWNGTGVKSDEGWTLTYYFEYYTTPAEEAQVDTKIAELVAEWTAMDMTDYQIIRTIYEYITENVTYDDAGLTSYQNAVRNDTLSMSHCKIFTAYKALIQGKAVCQGYANLFYRLALEMGIDARIIASIRLENHAWNIVQLGRWYYNIDATWDAKNVNTGYQWFLLNEAEFSTEHTRRDEFDTEAFHEAYPMGYGSYVGISDTMTGICGDDLKWTLTPDGELSITGTGSMYDYVPAGKDGESAPWLTWKTAITRLTIGAETGSVGAAAFSGMKELTEVVIPGSVQTIGTLAFADCDGIAALTLGDGVRSIASGAFANCGGLTTVTLPAAASVEDAPFYGCTALEEILLANGNKTLALDDAGVLMDAAYTHVYQAPAAADLEYYTVPETVTGIGAGAFAYCSDLRSVHFSGAVPEIHASAFYGTSANLLLYYPAYAAGWKSPTMTFAGMDVYGNALSVTVKTQSYPVKGDISCDSRVTAADAKLFAQYFAGYPVEIQRENADIDRDGSVTRADAIILNRYLAGWEGYGRYFAG